MNFLDFPIEIQEQIVGHMSTDDRLSFSRIGDHFDQIEKKAGHNSFTNVEFIPVRNYKYL